MKKGAIPIETIAILVIVMIVMIILIAFFMGVFGPGRANVEYQQKFYQECGKWTAVQCVEKPSADLESICANWQGVDMSPAGYCDVNTTTCCEQWLHDSCGCPK